MTVEKLIKEKKGTIVDVRTTEEFRGGHVAGSINIPLQEVPQRMEEIQGLSTPILLCCASGNRSGMATRMISQHSIECYNAGSWLDVNYYQSQN